MLYSIMGHSMSNQRKIRLVHTKIGTQGEKDLGNSQKKIEKIYILVIKGQRLVPMTFDLQVN